MTGRELGRYVADVYFILNREADRLDPKRRRQTELVLALDRAANALRFAAYHATGKFPEQLTERRS